MRKYKIFAFLTFIFIQSLFAQIKVLSPVEGSWANKQMLVIETNGCNDIFYSLNGSDPATFGFAYDGPVLLDVEGTVQLRISHINSENKKEDLEINYSVFSDRAYNTNYSDFVSTFIDTGMINYLSGTDLILPENLLYKVSDTMDFSETKDLSLDEKNILSDLIPLTIKDPIKEKEYRIIVKTTPQNAGLYSRRDVPFSVTDWNTINFTNENLLFKIDSEYWELPKESRILDRSVSHMIYWQDLNYEQGNPVEFFVLPPKPEVKIENLENGALQISVEGEQSDDYTIGLKKSTEDYQELFSVISVDTFDGNRISGVLNLDIFSNSVYQGSLDVNYDINKSPVTAPKIESNAKAFYSHKKVDVIIKNQNQNSKLFVALSKPVVVSDSAKIDYLSISDYEKDLIYEYEEQSTDNISVTLNSIGEGAAYYKIFAYSDTGDKKSIVSEYSVIVDEYNYYYDLNGNPDNQDGTVQNPFTSFDKCLEAVNSSRSVCIHVNGNIVIPSGKNVLTSNCELKTQTNSLISFEPGSSLVVQNSSLQINNVRIQNKADNEFKNIIPLIKLENSVLVLKECVIGTEFAKNGSVIESINSIVNITNCIASINASSYASFMTGVNSKFNIENSTITAFADTALIISANEGTLNLFKNSMKISGRTGRVGEFFGTNVTASNNNFAAQFSGTVTVQPMYINKTAKLKETNNEYSGF